MSGYTCFACLAVVDDDGEPEIIGGGAVCPACAPESRPALRCRRCTAVGRVVVSGQSGVRTDPVCASCGHCALCSSGCPTCGWGT